MKKIWLLMLMVCTMGVFTACSDDDNGDKTPVNPITNCSVPSTAEIGTEVTVRGEGFDATVAKLILKDSENKETVIQNPSFTSSGAIFSIPMSLKEGKYTVILNQNGTWELGKITLTPASLPVTDLNIPEVGGIGKSLTIGGNGFNQTAEVYLENESGTRTQLTVNDRSTGLTCTVPATAAKGDYKLILKQNGGEWTLTDKITLTVVKRLKSIENSSTMIQTGDIGDGTIATITMVMGTRWSLERNTQGISKVNNTSIYTVTCVDEDGNHIEDQEGDMSSTEAYNVAFTDNKYTFTYDGEYPTNDTSLDPTFSLTLADGKVSNSTVKYANGRTGEYNWKYDNEGYLTDLAVASGKSYATYTYEDKNLIEFQASNGASFTYTNKEYKNNPFGVDVAACYMAATGVLDSYLVVAHMMDWCGNKSVNVPSEVPDMNWETEEMINIPLTYEYDEDGYVTSVSCDTSMGPVKITFEYENVQ